MLPASAWNGTGQKKVEFTVSTPRETAVQLVHRLNASHQERSNFLNVTLQDRDPKLAALTLNTFADEYVQVAGELWSAKSDKAISAGSPIRVIRRDGFVLIVEKNAS